MINLLIFLITTFPVVTLIIVGYILYYNVKVKLIKNLKYTREFSMSGVFEGEELVLTETIYNGSFLPLFYVDVETYVYNNLKLMNYSGGDFDSSMQLIISRFHLMPFMQIKRHHKIKCLRRSYYKLDSAKIITKEKTMYFDSLAEVYVYPKTVELQQISYPVNFLQGSSLSQRRVMQDPFSLAGIRNYTSGDPFNMINFKATAKSGYQGMQMSSIKVNKLDYCSDRIFMIYINFQPPSEVLSIPSYIHESLMENALSFAASFISEALRNGYKAGFAANCRLVNGEGRIVFPIVGGVYHIEEMLREMAKAQIIRGVSFASLLESGTKTDIYNAEIFVITPYIDNNIDKNIAILRRRNNAVTVITLENEDYLKFLSSVVVSEYENI